MTPDASAAAWQQPHKAGRVGRCARVAAAIVAGLILSQYLAGFFFLLAAGLRAQAASPLTIARYACHYGDIRAVRRRLILASGVGVVLVGGSALTILLPHRRSLHGDARFATRREIAAAGLFADRGILLGQIGRRFLMLPGQQGVALAAPPRAGKGVGVVVPNLLTWPDSVICVDIKKENWTLTAGFRAQRGQQTYLFDPLSPDGRTACWNPLDYVSENPNQRISDLQLISNMFFPDPVHTDPFWMASGRTLFVGIALYLFATPSMPRTIGEILRQGMANDEEGFAHHWRRVIQGRMSGSLPLPEQCVRALLDIIDLAPQTTSSIRKTFTSRLELWLNPVLDAATATSDFDLRALRSRRISIYLGVMPKDLDRLAPLLSLFFQQALALQTDQLPEHNPALKYQVLLVLDEFPALGFIPIIAKVSGFLAGYNIRILLIMQTPAQPRQVYGEDGSKTILKTLAARIYFSPKDMEDAEEISKELGFTTVKVKSYSRPQFASFESRSRRSVSVSEQKRPLMLAQEVRDMGAGQEIIIMENLRPIRAKKLRYYAIPMLRRRVVAPPPLPAIAAARSQEPRKAASIPRNAADVPVEGAADIRTSAAHATREATADDLQRIDSLTLEDFETDFSGVQIPEKDGPLSDAEMSGAVNSFLETLRVR